MRREGPTTKIRRETLEMLAGRKRKKLSCPHWQLSGGERPDDYHDCLCTAQIRWANGWKPLIVPADLSCLLLSEYQMVPICCMGMGGEYHGGGQHTQWKLERVI